MGGRKKLDAGNDTDRIANPLTMKKLLFITCLFSLTVNAQKKDSMRVNMNIGIREITLSVKL
jgi:hypothetical protein